MEKPDAVDMEQTFKIGLPIGFTADLKALPFLHISFSDFPKKSTTFNYFLFSQPLLPFRVNHE
jgi:hypothetical protein